MLGEVKLLVHRMNNSSWTGARTQGKQGRITCMLITTSETNKTSCHCWLTLVRQLTSWFTALSLTLTLIQNTRMWIWDKNQSHFKVIQVKKLHQLSSIYYFLIIPNITMYLTLIHLHLYHLWCVCVFHYWTPVSICY